MNSNTKRKMVMGMILELLIILHKLRVHVLLGVEEVLKVFVR